MLLVSVTYEVVTPESAEDGDAAESGFLYQDDALTFRQVIDLLREHPHPSQSGPDYGPRSWATSEPVPDGCNMTEGAIYSQSVHFAHANPARKGKYWAKAMQYVYRK